MRLINADNLRAEILKDCENCPNNGTNYCHHVCELNYYTHLIDNAPTVDKTDVISYIDGLIDGAEAVRPHGKWIPIEGFLLCSNCKNRSCCKGNFCPDCGADMREGVDNG